MTTSIDRTDAELPSIAESPLVSLRDCCRAIRGVTFPSVEARHDPFDGSIACLTTSAVQDEIDWDSARYVPERFMRSDDQVVQDGDLLVSTANSKALVGKLAMARMVPARATFGAFVTTLRPTQIVTPSYLFYALRTERARHYFFETSSETTNISNLRTEDLLAFEIPVPSLADQYRISQQLTRALAAVDVTRTTTEERRAAATALPASYLRDVFDSQRRYPLRRLDEIADITLGKMASPKSRTGQTPLAYLRNANVQWGRFELDHLLRMDFNDTERRKFELRANDLMVCEGGEPGRAAVWHGQLRDCYFQKALFRVRPFEGVADATFLMYRFWHGAFTHEFSSSNATTTIAHLPLVRLSALELPLPPLEDQQRIAADLSQRFVAADAVIARCRSEVATVNALPGSLLRAAFNGYS